MDEACCTNVKLGSALRFGKLEGKRPLWSPGFRWVDDIKMDLSEMELKNMEWVYQGKG